MPKHSAIEFLLLFFFKTYIYFIYSPQQHPLKINEDLLIADTKIVRNKQHFKPGIQGEGC